MGSGILAAIDAIAEVDPAIQPSTGEDRPGVEPPPVTPGAYAPDIIVALTDGASNYGPDRRTPPQQAATRGLRVYTIGFGTPGRRRARADLCDAVPWPRARRRRDGSAVAAGSAVVAAASGAASTTRPSSTSPT